METPSLQISAPNQETFRRLELALSLNLRRQIWFAICDDLSLRNQLANGLHIHLNQGALAGLGHGYPQLVTLDLDLTDPHFTSQVSQWLLKYPPNRYQANIPGFQLIGVERLTRQPALVQRLFLSYLQNIDRHLPTLEASLLLWVSRPWCFSIQQSAPEFWQWRTGVFEFVSELTAPSATTGSLTRPEANGTLTSNPVSLFAESEKGDGLKPLTHSREKLPPDPVVVLSHGKEDEPETPPHSNLVSTESPIHDASLIDSPSSDLIEGSTPIQPPEGELSQSIEVIKNNGVSSPSIDPPEVGAQPPPIDDSNDLSRIAASALLNELSRLVLATLPVNAQQWAKQKYGVINHRTHPESLILEDGSFVPASPTDPTDNPLDESEMEPILLLWQLQDDHNRTQEPTALVNGYLALGNFYRQQIEQGDVNHNTLKIAILTYEQAAHWLGQAITEEPDEVLATLAPGFWSDLYNDLGNFYWMLSRCMPSLAEEAPALQKAIDSYHHALHYLRPDPTQPDHILNSPSYGMIHNNLGGVYSDLARTHAPINNLQQAICSYLEALRYRPAEVEPLKYASTQNNLGTAHWNLAQYEQPKLNLKQAVISYTEALKYYDPETEPVNFAMMKNNLGTAYWNLAQHEPNSSTELLSLAIKAYQTALTYRKVESFPSGHAATQNNLGTAYWHFANQPKLDPVMKQKCLQLAIAAYDAALTIVQQLQRSGQPLNLNFDYFATHNNLGVAHFQFATNTSLLLDTQVQMEHLQTSLNQHLQALQGWKNQPEFYDKALGYIVQTIKACFQSGGLQGQNSALSRIPPTLLPEMMRRL